MKLKKALIAIIMVCLSMLTFAGCTAAGTGAEGAGSSSLTAFVPILLIFGVMYVLMIVPESKRKKKAQQMRDSVEVGDKITTIGGMIGKVVHVTSDNITFETGEDRVRIEVAKWAISSNDGKGANKESADSEETLNK